MSKICLECKTVDGPTQEVDAGELCLVCNTISIVEMDEYESQHNPFVVEDETYRELDFNVDRYTYSESDEGRDPRAVIDSYFSDNILPDYSPEDE